jgi:hypothetical protein
MIFLEDDVGSTVTLVRIEAAAAEYCRLTQVGPVHHSTIYHVARRGN